MAGKTISTSETKIEALRLQSSAYGVAIPVVGGVTRVAGNLIYQTDFKAIPTTTSQGGKGGGAKVQNTTYSYSTSLLMALCHGQVSAIPRVWVGKKKYADDSGAVVLTTTSESFAIAADGGIATVSHAAAFKANVSVTSAYQQGVITVDSDPSAMTQYAEGVDYTVKNGVYTFNSTAGGSTVTITYQYQSSGAGSTALSKLGITLVPGSLSQSPPSWVSSRHASEALAYAGLAYVSADGYSLGTGAQVENHNFEVVGPGAYSITPTTPDIDPSTFTFKVLQDARYGANFPSAFIDAVQDWSKYCVANGLLMSPALTAQTKAAEFLSTMAQLTNTGVVWSGGRIKMIPYGDAAVTGYGVTFTPNVTPIYDLTDDAYIVTPGEPPVRARRKKQSDAYNHIRVQCRNRANDYAPEIAEAKDQADIDTNGLRSAQILQADWICDPNVARQVAQLILQRSVNVRATYQFTLPWNFAMLEPMDLVTLTDSGLGLNKQPVRITSITEADGELRFEAEEFALGVANSATYGTQVGSGFWNDFNVAPGSASAPAIFEAPLAMSSSGLAVYVAATGLGASWGGCRVWVSLDGTNYREIGKISGGSRYGTLSTVVGSTVDVTLNTGQLTSGSAADSAAYSTLCYVGGTNPEYLAYQTATLTGTEQYTLGGLTRGGYATPVSAHSVGDPFVRVDSGVVVSGPLDLSMIGKTIHIKLTSFNVFGLNEEALGSVAEYTYTITGAMTKLAPSAPTGLAYALEATGVRFTCTKNPEITVIGYEWRIGSSTSTWATATVLDKLGGTSELWSTTTAGDFIVYVAAVDKMGNVSAPASLPVTIAATQQKFATAWLYQWAAVSPTAPSGSMTYTWSSGAVTGTLGGWSTTIPSNPGTPGLQLWTVSQQVSDLYTATTTAFTWTSTNVAGFAQNGQTGPAGTQAAPAFVYQWAASTPSISGTSTYTWATGGISPVPSGWTTASTASPSPGMQLYRALVNITDVATAATTSINWSGASILVVGQAPYNGASARTAYARFAGTTPTSGTVTTSGASSLPSSTQSSSTWGFATGWSTSDPNPSSTNSLWQTDGLYDPSTGNIVWTTPYISSLKVGQLSAVSASTGSLTVDGALTIGSTGNIGGGKSTYTDTSAGFFLGYAAGQYRFVIGDATRNLTWDGSALNITGAIRGSSTIQIGSGSSSGGYAFEVNTAGVVWAMSGFSATSIISITGTSGTTNAIYAVSQNNSEAVRGEVANTNANTGAHGVRGYNYHAIGTGTGSVASAGVGGFIGGANGYDAYMDGNGQNYGPFTGTHDILIPNDIIVEPGMIVVDNGVVQRNGWSCTITEGAISCEPNQRGVLGVVPQPGRPLSTVQPAAFVDYRDPETKQNVMLPSYDALKDEYTAYGANALGEGQLLVCGEGGDIAQGDLIVTSSTPGVGMRQADDVVRGYTVAKAREAIIFDDTTTPKAVACIYLCG